MKSLVHYTVDEVAAFNFWMDMVVFLNTSGAKGYHIQMDGAKYSLVAK